MTLLARVALLQGDARHFFTEIKAIERLAFEGKEFRCVTASEVSLGYLYSLLDIEEKIPNWLFRMDAIRQELYPVSAPFAHIITLRWLRRHKPEEFIGTAEALIQESRARHHLLPVLYAWLEQAVYYEQTGARDMARERVEQALSHALLDKVYLPIAEYYAELSGVLEDPDLHCADTVGLDRVRSLCKRFASGAEAVRAVIFGDIPTDTTGTRNRFARQATPFHAGNRFTIGHFSRHSQKHAEQNL